ncbi:MAG TPA: FUSC family protein [Solirubrobacteraceae bacterium]|nr:FUSC family protein [Solirubrobacteraceae bacterium]
MSSTAGTPTAVGRAFRQVSQFDRARISVRAGAVAAVPVAAMLALGIALGSPTDAVTMGVGAMLVGVSWRAGDGPLSPPVGTMCAATTVLTLCTLAGTLTGRWPWLHLGVLAVVCVLAGLATALGRRGITPGNQAIIAFVVFGRFPENLANAAGLAGLVLAGGIAQTLFASTVARPAAWRRERQALADAYRRLAELAESLGRSLVPSAGALEQADSVLGAPALFADPDRSALIDLVEEGRRIRLELAVLSSALTRATHDDPELYSRGKQQVDRALARLQLVLRQIVAAVEGSRSALAWLASEAAALTSWGAEREPLALEYVDERLGMLIGQVTAAARLAAALDPPGGGGHPTLGSRGLWRRVGYRMLADLEQIRINATLRAAPGRHALRLAVVVAGTELLTQRIALPRGYWAVVAAALVLRPGFGATFTRGAERVLGTCGGVVIATFIAVAIDPSGWGLVAVVALLSFGCYAVFPASFAAGTAMLTAVIVFLLHAVAGDSVTTALYRLLDTAIGGGIGLLAYALWPTWTSHYLGPLLSRLAEAQREYLSLVLDGLATGERPDDGVLRAHARLARVLFTDSESAVTLARNEPQRGDLDPRAAAATLGALRRLVYGVHALRLELTQSEHPRPRPYLAPLGAGLDAALRVSIAQLRGDAEAGDAAALRRLYRQIDWQPDDLSLRLALDDMVDAVNSAAAPSAP